MRQKRILNEIRPAQSLRERIRIEPARSASGNAGDWITPLALDIILELVVGFSGFSHDRSHPFLRVDAAPLTGPFLVHASLRIDRAARSSLQSPNAVAARPTSRSCGPSARDVRVEEGRAEAGVAIAIQNCYRHVLLSLANGTR